MNRHRNSTTLASVASLLLMFTVLAGCVDAPSDQEPPGDGGTNVDPEVPPPANQSLWLNGSRTLHVIKNEVNYNAVTGNPVTGEPGWNCVVFHEDELHRVVSGTLTASWEPEDDVRPIPELQFFWSVFGDEGNDDRKIEGPSPLSLEMTPAENPKGISVGVRERDGYSAIENLTVEISWNVEYEGVENVTVGNGGC